MKRTWTIIVVADVARSSAWYHPGTMELSLRDPDGYHVTIRAL